MLGPLEDLLVEWPAGHECRCAGQDRSRQPQRDAAAAPGEHAARLLAHRGGPRARQLPADGPCDIHGGARERIPLGGGACGASAGRGMRAAGRAHVRGPGHVGEDRPQPAVQRIQVHLRRRDRRRAAGVRRPGRAGSARHGHGHPGGGNARGSSSASIASRTPAGARTRAAASASRSCRSWSSCTAARSRRAASSTRARPSRSPSRRVPPIWRRTRSSKSTPPKRCRPARRRTSRRRSGGCPTIRRSSRAPRHRPSPGWPRVRRSNTPMLRAANAPGSWSWTTTRTCANTSRDCSRIATTWRPSATAQRRSRKCARGGRTWCSRMS